MSVKQAYKDLLALSVIIALPVVLIFSIYNYLLSNDQTYLYFGLGAALAIVVAAIVRYMYVVDYIWTLLKSWK
jgi:hypothetical protein